MGYVMYYAPSFGGMAKRMDINEDVLKVQVRKGPKTPLGREGRREGEPFEHPWEKGRVPLRIPAALSA